MRKYRIVPQKENMLWQLAQGMTLTDAEKSQIKSTAIRHVEVCASENSWEIVLTTQTLLKEQLLTEIAEQIKGKYQ